MELTNKNSKSKINISNLGLNDLEAFMAREDINHKKINFVFIGVGQAGSRMAIEYARMGYYVILINSCPEDNNNAERILKKMVDVKYKIVTLEGSDGANKDRLLAQYTFYNNLELYEELVLNDEKILKAEYAFVGFSLDGGNGSGIGPLVVNTLSNHVFTREKRIGFSGYDLDTPDEYIINDGRPPVSVLAAFPDKSMGPNLLANAGDCLKELQELQDAGHCGSIGLIDNQFLKDNFLEKKSIHAIEKWYTEGNMKTANIITELTSIISMPTDDTFDKAEFYDVITRPAYLVFTKREISANDFCKDDTDYEGLVNSTLTENNLFLSDVDYTKTDIAGYVLLHPTYGQYKNQASLRFDNAVRQYFRESGCDNVHAGTYRNNYYGTFKERLENSKARSSSVLLYTFAAVLEPPARVKEMIALSNEELKRKDEIKQGVKRDLGGSYRDRLKETPKKSISTKKSLKDTIGRPGAKRQSTTPAHPSINIQDRLKKKFENK